MFASFDSGLRALERKNAQLLKNNTEMMCQHQPGSEAGRLYLTLMEMERGFAMPPMFGLIYRQRAYREMVEAFAYWYAKQARDDAHVSVICKARRGVWYAKHYVELVRAKEGLKHVKNNRPK